MNKKEEKTNELILAALERLLEKKSYTDISVSDIILESTVSRSTFYAHYKKKDDVLNASGLLVTYDINLEKVDEKFYTNNKTYSFTKIINNDGKYLAIGNTNSKINNKYLKTNGLDFYPVIEKEA